MSLKKSLLLLLIASLSHVDTTVATVNPQHQQDRPKKRRRRLQPNDEGGKYRVWVSYHNGHDAIYDEFNAKPGCSVKEDLMPINKIVMTVDDEGLDSLWQNDFVDDVEEDGKRYLIPTMPSTPPKRRALRELQSQCTDPQCERLYGISHVQAHQVWAEGYRGANVKVCVIDSGLAETHQDFDWSHMTGDTSTLSLENWKLDGNGHGTHVTGTIAAADNGSGVIGVAPDAHIHVVKVFRGPDSAWSWGSTLVAAAYACRDAGAKIINLSLGGRGEARGEKEAFEQLWQDGILSIAAAGNDASPDYFYPASQPTVMSVSATDPNRGPALFSQHNDQVDIAAPGVSIRSCVPGNNYAFWDGTSMAAPHIAGIAALLWSAKPTATNAEIREAIYASALDLGPKGHDERYGHGLAQAKDALDLLLGHTKMPSLTPSMVPTSPTTIPSMEPSYIWEPPTPPTTPTTPTPPTPPSTVPSLLPSSMPSLEPSSIPSYMPSFVPSSAPVEVSCSADMNLVELNVRSDYWGDETGTVLKNARTDQVLFSKTEYPNEELTIHPLCLELANTCYKFTITDSRCDGLILGGYYAIDVDGAEVKRNSAFGCSDEVFLGNCSNEGDEATEIGGDNSGSNTYAYTDNGDCPDGKDQLVVEMQMDFAYQENIIRIQTGRRVFRRYGPFGPNTYRENTVCIPSNTCYHLIVTDSYNDGMCCGYGNGYVRAFRNGEFLGEISEFADEAHLEINC